VDQLLAEYRPPALSDELKGELRRLTTSAAQHFGMSKLPPLPKIRGE
jgi:hypothetical protein